MIKDFDAYFDQFQFSRALESAWALIGAVNKYLVENEPWTVGDKNDEASRSRLGDDSLHIGGSAADGNGAGASGDSGVDGEDLVAARAGRHSQMQADGFAVGTAQVGNELGKVEPVFPRADKSAIERMQHLEDKDGRRLRQQNPSRKHQQEQVRRQVNRRHKR